MNTTVNPTAISGMLYRDFTTYRWSFVWSWIGLCLPSLYYWLLINSTTVTVTDKLVSHGVGIITKTYTNIDLYQVKTVSATESFFTGGQLVFHLMDGSTRTISYVQDAGRLSGLFRGLIDAQRSSQNMYVRETF
jgi:hypothetical protein